MTPIQKEIVDALKHGAQGAIGDRPDRENANVAVRAVDLLALIEIIEGESNGDDN